MTPTPEQEAILAEARSPDSLLINALAGAAKTTTLVLLSRKLNLEPTLALAFNKRAAEDLAKRMPSHIDCKTLNSLGHNAWGGKLFKRLILDSDKKYKWLTEYSNKTAGEEKKQIKENFQTILRSIELAKSYGYVPKDYHSMGRSLVDWFQLQEVLGRMLDIEPDGWLHKLIDDALADSITKSFSGTIDFSDQLYMPTLFGGKFTQYPIVMVDEAQDLSMLNHEMLKQVLAPRGKLIAVGDPNQSIYAFRGASRGSMDELREHFRMKEFTLSVSFRCPQAIVKRAQARVPHFRWAEGAIEGAVILHRTFKASDIPDYATVLSRNNAPLMSLGLKMIRAGRSVKFAQLDIGKNLIRLMQKLGAGTLTPAESLPLLDAWQDKELSSCHDARRGPIIDKAECMRVFLSETNTLMEACDMAEYLFQQEGSILFMTGHKSKGGEWDIVFHLDPWMIPSKWAREAAEFGGDTGPMDQELNLKYVIETRSKVELHLINLKEYEVA